MDQFRRLLEVLDALPFKLPDERPLREVIPGAWPTVGDLRELIKQMDANH